MLVCSHSSFQTDLNIEDIKAVNSSRCAGLSLPSRSKTLRKLRLRNFRSEQHFKDTGPRKITVVACLHLLANANERLPQILFAACVNHLLFDGCSLRAPVPKIAKKAYNDAQASSLSSLYCTKGFGMQRNLAK
jgi:hypothetical protein